MSTSNAGGKAADATVVTDAATDLAAYRRALADDAEAGVKATRAQIKSLSDSLKDREAEAKRLRAEAKEN